MTDLSCESVARAALGEPAKRVGAELLWPCPNHDDVHPSFAVNPNKNVWLCGPCGASGTPWQLAAFIAHLDPSDKKGITAWLRERSLLNGAGGNSTGRSVNQKRVAEFHYSAELRKARLEPARDGSSKEFVWEHRIGHIWKRCRGCSHEKPLYTNALFRELRERNQLGIVLGFEGEAKADLAGELGFAAFSFKDLTPAQCSVLARSDLILWPDKDQPGSVQCHKAATILHNSKQLHVIRMITPPLELPLAGDIVDAVRALGWGRGEIESLIRNAPEWKPTAGNSNPQPGAVLRCFRDIAPERLRWLWPGRIPLRKLTLLIGDPGLGKSLLTIDIASRVTRGTTFPDGATCESGSVVFLSAEDDAADTIRPRLDAASADVAHVHELSEIALLSSGQNIHLLVYF